MALVEGQRSTWGSLAGGGVGGKPSLWVLWRVGIRRLGWGPVPKLTVPENSGVTGTRGPNPGFCPMHLV